MKNKGDIMSKNKVIILCLSLIIVASITASIYLLVNQSNTTDTNNNIVNIENLDTLKDIKYDNLDITDQTITVKDNTSNYIATIKNNTATDYDIDTLYVIFYQEDTTKEVLVLKNTKILKDTTRTINLSINTSLAKITKIEYLKK